MDVGPSGGRSGQRGGKVSEEERHHYLRCLRKHLSYHDSSVFEVYKSSVAVNQNEILTVINDTTRCKGLMSLKNHLSRQCSSNIVNAYKKQGSIDAGHGN
eukprot:3910139-Ditylum_brightwellii.AAC.1